MDDIGFSTDTVELKVHVHQQRLAWRLVAVIRDSTFTMTDSYHMKVGKIQGAGVEPPSVISALPSQDIPLPLTAEGGGNTPDKTRTLVVDAQRNPAMPQDSAGNSSRRPTPDAHNPLSASDAEVEVDLTPEPDSDSDQVFTAPPEEESKYSDGESGDDEDVPPLMDSHGDIPVTVPSAPVAEGVVTPLCDNTDDPPPIYSRKTQFYWKEEIPSAPPLDWGVPPPAPPVPPLDPAVQEERSVVTEVNRIVAAVNAARAMVLQANACKRRPARQKLVKRVLTVLKDTGMSLYKRDDRYVVGDDNHAPARAQPVLPWAVEQPPPPYDPAFGPEYVRVAKNFAAKKWTRAPKQRPLRTVGDLALLDRAEQEWQDSIPERELPGPQPVPNTPETTKLGKAQPHDAEWYFTATGGVGMRFHKPTVDAIADVTKGCFARTYPSLRERDLDMERMASARAKAVFEFVRRPREEHGYGLDVQSMREYEVGGRNEATALYCAEAVMCANRSWALQLRATQPSRDFVQHNKLGAYRKDGRKEFQEYAKTYGEPLPACKAFRARVHNFWERLKHPLSASRRHILPTVELPRALRRVGDSEFYQHAGGKDHPFDEFVPDMMQNINDAVRAGKPVIPTYRNFR